MGGTYATSFYATAVLGGEGLDMYLVAVAGIAVGVLTGRTVYSSGSSERRSSS
ncbi:hypothetical protein [Pseudonocardia kujensis]|uniref:hypothetical protein n=1 Tax=Pseudonocardia kujensis TaxID=1128675 RepID=UPI001E40B0E4|nr:hypothetical protein [Pseudonocardia kujensis]